MTERPRFAIFASGRGSNAEALMQAFAAGELEAELALVLSNRAAAPVLERAAARGVATLCVPSKGTQRQAHEDLLLTALSEHRVEHVLLAGYMRILSPHFLGRFPGSVLNIHPSLLPDFPGLDVQRAQWEAGVRVAGATVHLVDEGVDTGPVLLQGTLDVRGDEGPEGLADRILNEVEHVLYPRAVRLFLERLKRAPGRVMETPMSNGKIHRALLSVSDKRGLVELGQALAGGGVQLIASGGTAGALEAAGVPVTKVEVFTDSPEILEGRVKTLHPKIHAGILADRRKDTHLSALAAAGYAPIDLVVVNLYPFEATVASGAPEDEVVENIDIGGPTLLRAAAKNADGGVTVICDPDDYSALMQTVAAGEGVALDRRRALAAKVFESVAAYDHHIAAWTAARGSDDELPAALPVFTKAAELRYGENPHQPGALYLSAAETGGLARGRQLGGKALSYNNYLDMDGAYRAVAGLTGPACVVVKHTNPCGMAEAADQAEAFRRALEGDPISAFGSVIAFNAPLSAEGAQAIREAKLFVECIVAPGFDEAAVEALAKKTNLRLFEVPSTQDELPIFAHRISGGLLVQATDPGDEAPETWQVVSKRGLEAGWQEELSFSMRCAQSLKSNAISVCGGRQLFGAGAGQMSRVDAMKIALDKAGDKAKGSFVGSDAFFPFADAVEVAVAAGVVALIQPGGSKRDQEVIDACDAAGLAMVFTGRRHFRH